MPLPKYDESGDPAGFAPDFAKHAEPYGDPVDRVLEAVESRAAPGMRILDVAGGYGRYAVPLALKGADVTIIDIHDASLHEATSRALALPAAAGSITTVQRDVVREGLNGFAEYDVALCIGFLHHLTPSGVLDVVRSVAAVLSDDGIAVLEFSADKQRRDSDGRPIMVSGVREQNLSIAEAFSLCARLRSECFDRLVVDSCAYVVRSPGFHYDAEMLIVSGISPKRSLGCAQHRSE